MGHKISFTIIIYIKDFVYIYHLGMRGREIPSNFPDSTKPEWAQEGSFRRQKDFQSS